ncbi:MAG: diphthine synthase [Thermoplasmata archaeon]|uniref:Diphthine synthase n=1 Tax=Candidatus Sysuiplasma superficiale TaxID=2823368 RepID=A0A8J8CDZ7_9ARCH|nr:diphthine synthase [Candidatus Sysuiplasma superficiale]MBX8643637.1 diphthine synthase [Candidatus Sysuiplasma superficiale]MCL4347252.1 diphthine synthase [Candidatus Thermoplasmatota archaeon]MCL5437154.1 diphthine synthase [Candidatus Thermoplasmatota archaeon]
MGRLVFVGAGLNGVRGMTLDALSEISRADTVFVERYTTYLPDDFEAELLKRTGKRALPLSRKAVEDGHAVLESSRKGSCVLIAGGDAMTATTHSSLRIAASRNGIDTVIVPGSSILTAAASYSGLQHYRFGRVVSVPRFTDSFMPDSVLDNIMFNLENNLHTLLLLDVDQEKGYYMQPAECFSQLLHLSSRRNPPPITGDTFACVVSRAGMEDCATAAGRISSLAERDFGRHPHSVIIPARLHFAEAESLVEFSGAVRDDINSLIM